jgi:hypothetical protein
VFRAGINKYISIYRVAMNNVLGTIIQYSRYNNKQYTRYKNIQESDLMFVKVKLVSKVRVRERTKTNQKSMS